MQHVEVRYLGDQHLEISECHKQSLCVDCKHPKCWFAGSIIADCPKYRCDRPEEGFEKCETCAFIKKYHEEMRDYYDDGK